MTRHRQRGFTLAEMAVVVAVIGVGLALGLTSIVDIARAQQKNAALAEANLALREERAKALESRKPRFVKPDPVGTGLVVGSATITTVGTTVTCSEGPIERRLDLGPIKARGERVCFTPDGTTQSEAPLKLDFVPKDGSTTAALAEVKVFPAGTLRWTGTSLFKATACTPSISVQNIANQSVSPIYLQ